MVVTTSLPTSPNAVSDGFMTQMKKITVEVNAEHLTAAQRITGQGVSETVREALRQLAEAQAQREFLALKGQLATPAPGALGPVFGKDDSE